MVTDKRSWAQDAPGEDEELQDWGAVPEESGGKTKKARIPSASHAYASLGIISHVAHSTATYTHNKGNFEPEDDNPLVRAHEAREGKLSDWISDREKAKEKDLSG